MSQLFLRLTLATALLVLAPLAASAAPAPSPACLEPDNGTGTVTLPPAGCEYLSPSQVHMIIGGLPAGTTIILKPIHRDFICRSSTGPGCGSPGGSLGGEREQFGSSIVLQASGTGALSGWSDVIVLNAQVVTDTGPRVAGAAVQTFKTSMVRLQGTVSTPDFQYLEIVAGSDFGLPSPGQTTLTKTSQGTFEVDSFFDVNYEITFEGSQSGRLAGYAGSTNGTVRMEAQGY